MKRLAEQLRKRLFWIFDTLKGSPTRTHYTDIANILENFESPESEKRRKALLANLLQHACETTPFYSQYGPLEKLQDFPVVDKMTIRDNFEAFQSRTYANGPKQEVSTSGSSGTPFRIYQNTDKVMRNRADTLYFQKIAGYELGYRLYYVRKWLSKYKKNRLATAIRNIEMVNVSDFSDAYLKKLIDTLKKDTSTKVILSYSSALRDICKYLEHTASGPIKTNISSIIAMAEELGDDTRKKLKFYFETPVYLRYSNQENGIISLQLSQKKNDLQINWASYFVEILHPEKDVPVDEGALGRVVVTDLFNYAVPFVRYDTGDLAVMTKQQPYFKGSSSFSKVKGRKMNVIWDTKGHVISGFNIHYLETYPEIRQFRFIQQDRTKYTIELVVQRPLSPEKQIIDHFKGFLGNDAEIEIVYTDEISRLVSGKRALVVNNYTKAKV